MLIEKTNESAKKSFSLSFSFIKQAKVVAYTFLAKTVFAFF